MNRQVLPEGVSPRRDQDEAATRKQLHERTGRWSWSRIPRATYSPASGSGSSNQDHRRQSLESQRDIRRIPAWFIGFTRVLTDR